MRKNGSGVPFYFRQYQESAWSTSVVLKLSWAVAFLSLTGEYLIYRDTWVMPSRQSYLVKASARGHQKTVLWPSMGAEGSVWETLAYAIVTAWVQTLRNFGCIDSCRSVREQESDSQIWKKFGAGLKNFGTGAEPKHVTPTNSGRHRNGGCLHGRQRMDCMSGESWSVNLHFVVVLDTAFWL